MTVVSICQHTKNDMTVWSREVESERDELLKNVNITLSFLLFIYLNIRRTVVFRIMRL